ncbi:L-arabinose isomerase [Anoxybacillus voinovskiensis]|uniref:L-arabinose isomerase n=1 Tax=Anoxybacteroides voinovskiense TaxID=230470 RepID=A0A840E2J6_9BACL|nr:DUF1871 family protein [Anoxybacillus voinovskiensis]MBB4075406.1 L-arabinose isomerase [Anoxybacillus voinovskiensis]GGJ78458.1 hypothetical protein GCM10008982_29790 [Anoxybacillus voinovskiensis]
MNQHLNRSLLAIVQQWDPFGYGIDAYEIEAMDVVRAVYEYDDVEKLARKIQAIYEFAFEQKIPLTKCITLARELLLMKEDSECAL